MKIFKYVILGAILMALFACENEKNTFSDNPSIYIGGDKEQNATADSVIFSFKKYDDAVQSYDLNLMVYVTGVVSDRARTFALEVLEDGTNVSSNDYTLGDMEIPAGAYYATLPVTVKRKVEGIDLAEQVASLTVRVKANENFEEGPEEYAVYKFVWCDYLIQPAWWQVGFTNVAGPFTQARYKFILDYYGDVDLFELGMIDPNTGYSDDGNKLYAFIAELIDLLNEYNATHDEPYMNDNGDPLGIGSGLAN